MKNIGWRQSNANCVHGQLSWFSCFKTCPQTKNASRSEPASRQLTNANGGHTPPLLWRSTERRAINLDTDGLILGILEQTPFEEKTITPNPGDILVLYTDGITEAPNPAMELFGEARLKQLLADHAALASGGLAGQIFQATGHFIQNAVQQDDMALLILKLDEAE